MPNNIKKQQVIIYITFITNVNVTVIGNCPMPPTITEKKLSKEVQMFLIDHDMHQGLCELVNTE